MTSSPADTITAHGRIVSVDSIPLGSHLAADAAVGVTQLVVVNAADFADSGSLTINGQVTTYSAVDDTTGTITIDDTLSAAAVEGDAVAVWDTVRGAIWTEKRALVQFDGDDGSADPIVAAVAQPLVASLVEGVREFDSGESVRLDYAEMRWRVVDVNGAMPDQYVDRSLVYDDTGTLRSVFGLQPDGTYTLLDQNAAAPPVPPATPTVATQPGLLVITSYGDTADGSEWPLDFSRIEVHVGNAPGFPISAGSKVADWGRNGGLVTVSLAAGTWYATLVAVNTSGTSSVRSTEVSADVSQGIGDPGTPGPSITLGLHPGNNGTQISFLDGGSEAVGSAIVTAASAEITRWQVISQQVAGGVNRAQFQLVTYAASLTSEAQVLADAVTLQATDPANVGGPGVKQLLADKQGVKFVGNPNQGGQYVKGMDFGALSVTFDATGQATIPHTLGTVPNYVAANGSSLVRDVRVTAASATALSVTLINPSTGAAVPNETRTVRWLAIA